MPFTSPAIASRAALCPCSFFGMSAARRANSPIQNFSRAATIYSPFFLWNLTPSFFRRMEIAPAPALKIPPFSRRQAIAPQAALAFVCGVRTQKHSSTKISLPPLPPAFSNSPSLPSICAAFSKCAFFICEILIAAPFSFRQLPYAASCPFLNLIVPRAQQPIGYLLNKLKAFAHQCAVPLQIRPSVLPACKKRVAAEKHAAFALKDAHASHCVPGRVESLKLKLREFFCFPFQRLCIFWHEYVWRIFFLLRVQINLFPVFLHPSRMVIMPVRKD